MDVRDFGVWSGEARRRSLSRKAELFGAALLPHQKGHDVRKVMDALRWQLHEIDWADFADEAEREYAEKVKLGLHRPNMKKKEEAGG